MRQILFFFTVLVSYGLSAQTIAPGGVSNPEIWFKTVPLTDSLQGNYYWKDFSGDSVKLIINDERGSLYGSEYVTSRNRVKTYNFNPAINLSAPADKSKQFLLNKTNLAQTTVVSVWAPDFKFERDMFLYALNGRPGEGYIFTKDKVIHSNESGKDILNYGREEGKNLLFPNADEGADLNKFQEQTLRIAVYNRALLPNHSMWGEKKKAGVSIGDIFYPDYPINTSTFNIDDSLTNKSFSGYTPELIIYSRILSPFERRKVESYLAIKYGLTLEKSYIGSNNRLLWDRDANAEYNTRITGYQRDDRSGLYQKTAATSYEEAPNFSYNFSDFYNPPTQDDSYNLQGPYRLLVMGLEDANAFDDGTWVLFGDNDKPLTATQEETGIDGMKLMKRRWLLNTNLSERNNTGILLPIDIILDPVFIDYEGNTFESKKQNTLWNTKGLAVSIENFKTSATKPGTSTDDFGYLVSLTPLTGKDGYLSCIIPSQKKGPFTIKFGTDNPQPADGAHDYGYYIDANGNVYKIIRGVRQIEHIASVSANRKIEISKEGNTVYLRVDDLRYYGYNITVDAADREQDFYGSIMIEKYGQDDILLTGIRRGGFEETGNKVELSYFCATEFEDYREVGKTYLVIDRSGTGNFSSSDVEYIPSDELDELRKKIIFNNVFWDTDANGKDVFTFGYSLSNPMTSPANCPPSQFAPPAAPEFPSMKTDPDLTVSNPADTYVVDASLHMDSPDAVTFIAFDAAGKPVSIVNQSSPRKIQEVRLNVHRSGIYIIKAISANGEYTGKIIVK